MPAGTSAGWHLLTKASSSPQGGNTIRQLLKIAKKTVPEEEWSRTPVVLKATAGLRLLPEDKARALLNEVRRRRSSPFDTQIVWRKGAGWKNHRATAAYTSLWRKKKTAVVRFCGEP